MDENNLYKEIGQIQGTLNSLVSTVNQGFGRFQKDIAELKSEVNSMVSSLTARIDKLDAKVEKLEAFKAGYDGSKEESRRVASVAGVVWGSAVSIVIAVAGWIISNFHVIK